MIYVGIDIAKKAHEVCFLNQASVSILGGNSFKIPNTASGVEAPLHDEETLSLRQLCRFRLWQVDTYITSIPGVGAVYGAAIVALGVILNFLNTTIHSENTENIIWSLLVP